MHFAANFKELKSELNTYQNLNLINIIIITNKW